MQTVTVNQNGSEAPKIKPLDGINDCLTWHRNMRCSLRHRDPLLLGIEPGPNRTSFAARTAWGKAKFSPKSSITFALTEPVQVRTMAYTDDDDKSAHEFWNFLESTIEKSNEQAIQNVRSQLYSLVYVEGTNSEKHLNDLMP